MPDTVRPTLCVLKPSSKAIQEALQDALNLPNAPKRIECFDISHIQGTDKVASMVVWEYGRMKKSDYRKFIIRTVEGNDDFASMREVITRRYGRLQGKRIHFRGWFWSMADWASCMRRLRPWNRLALRYQPLLRSPNVTSGFMFTARKMNRDSRLNSRRSCIWCKRSGMRPTVSRSRSIGRRRNAARLTSGLHDAKGIGRKTVEKLLRTFGSLERVKQATDEELTAAMGRARPRACAPTWRHHWRGRFGSTAITGRTYFSAYKCNIKCP